MHESSNAAEPRPGRDALYLAYVRAVRLAPHDRMLEAPDGSLSFAELDQRSDLLAARLAARLGPAAAGALVGILLPPCRDYYVALVACMKAGAIAMPLDPASPAGEAEPEDLVCCLSAEALQERAASLAAWVCIVAADQESVQKDDQLPDHATDQASEHASVGEAGPGGLPQALHRIVTSGSSGNRTRVTIGRSAMVIHAEELKQAYDYQRGRIYASLSRHTTAAGINFFWRVLLNAAGAQIVDLHQQGFDQIYDRMAAAGAVSLQGTVTTIGAFAAACGVRGPLESVRRVLFGGESVPPSLTVQIAGLLARDCIAVVNYSSTETMHISVHTAPLASLCALERIPCGKPLPSRRVTLLGPDLQPVPAGEIGEIVVTSAWLALALEGPGLAERFYPHPEDPALRVYHTRDQGRWNAQGLLEHCGRLDRQLKIRGQRVDPLRVEQALDALAGVSRAVVLGLDRGEGQTELVACVVRDQALAPDLAIYAWLGARLPAACLPSRIVDLAVLPQLDGGKLDLAAIRLAAQVQIKAAAEPSDTGTGEESPLRQLLRQEWARVLGRTLAAEPGSFVAEGGNSLDAARLIAALGRLGWPGLDPVWVARHPTLAAQEQALLAQEQALLAQAGGLTPATPQSPAPRLDHQAILRRLGWV